MSVEPSPERAPAGETDPALHSRAYLGLLVIAALVGIPISLIAFGFLAAVHELEHIVWDTLPADLGFDGPPAWWPIVTLGIAGVLVALAVTKLPGHGGHVPAEGLGGGVTPLSDVPGAVLAATASLVLGAVVGPEAPLIVLGGGLAVLAVKWMAVDDKAAVAVMAAAGSSAAISAIFGNPLLAAILILEVAGLARRQMLLIALPCLVSSEKMAASPSTMLKNPEIIIITAPNAIQPTQPVAGGRPVSAAFMVTLLGRSLMVLRLTADNRRGLTLRG